MVNQFLRLEKIEFSGIKGQMLSDLVAEMFTEFTDKSSQFQGVAKEPLNIADTVRNSLKPSIRYGLDVCICVQVFIGQYETFKREMEDMEQRLGQIVCLAFDDCSGSESVLKVHTHTHTTTPPCQLSTSEHIHSCWR